MTFIEMRFGIPLLMPLIPLAMAAVATAHASINPAARIVPYIAHPFWTGRQYAPSNRRIGSARPIDSDLAALYGVATKRFNEAVARNARRFPADFMFVLSNQELGNLRSQNATSSSDYGGRRYLPRAFTEHRAIMAATILNTERAEQMSVYVVRAFVRLRVMPASNALLARKLEALEKSVAALDSDTRLRFYQVYEAILGLMSPAARRQ